jgi:energy-coupling factor transporter ATP-binding protein EcfA2
MTALVASGIWALQDSRNWPPLWASAEGPAARVGWLTPTDQTPAERYLSYRSLMLDIDPEDPARATTVLSWWRTNFCGIDATTPDRCTENAELASAYYEQGRHFVGDQESRARSNAQAITGDLVLAGGALIPALATVLGTELRREPTSLRYGSNQSYRTDAFVVWRDSASKSGLGPRLWVTAERVIVGLFPGRSHEGWTAESAEALLGVVPPGLEWFSVQASDGVYSLTPTGDAWAGGSWLLGRAFTYEEASHPSFEDQIVDVATELKPLIEHLDSVLAGEPTPPEDVHVDDETEGIDHLAVAAEHLLIDPAYLEELVWYLRDKKQIVLYGPPGTGKTYLARTVARALAEQDPVRVEIVQFHPATSYEDFFEGIRPKVVDGTVVYDVEKGPLARLAERAMADRDHDHVLLIDELNRANLPKVLGELLFLLEYRDESISTLYREKFELPDNLLIIATMNTADRSIALVDAAMRRRFHFRPFFPADEPVASLLRSWLDDRQLDTHIADLLDGVNIELTRDLGRDLQLGPSHFMRTDICEDGILPRIWRANIEPFIEDHLFDQPDAIARYRWEQVRDRHAPTPTTTGPDPEDDADDS